MLDVEFVLAQQPLAQVAIDFVDTFPEFVRRNGTKMADRQIFMHFLHPKQALRRAIRSGARACKRTSYAPPCGFTSPVLHPKLKSRILRAPAFYENLGGLYRGLQLQRNCDGPRNHADRLGAPQ